MSAKLFFEKSVSVLKKALESYYPVPVLFLFAFICWFFKWTLLVVYVFLAVFVLILLICRDVKNIFALVLYISFFITDIGAEPHWAGYFVAIFCAVAAMIYFAVRNFLADRKTLKKGKMFYPLVVASVAFLLGGVGRFDALSFFITLGFCIVNYYLYFLAVNYTVDLNRYLAYLFIIGAAVLSVQIMFVNTFIKDIRPFETPVFFSAQTVNTAAVFIFLGSAGCFGMGHRTKADALYMLLSVFFTFAVFITCCRTMILIAVAAEVALYVMFIGYSKNPYRFVWANLALCVAIILLGAFYDVLLKPIVAQIMSKDLLNLNGRNAIWNFCMEKLREYPLFGYGWLVDGDYSFLREGYPVLLAHNTLLQWVASLGIVGAALISYFYIVKYKIVFSEMSHNKIFTLFAVLGIALSGMMDQAASMDFFVFLTPLILLADAEKELRGRRRINKFRFLKGSE